MRGKSWACNNMCPSAVRTGESRRSRVKKDEGGQRRNRYTSPNREIRNQSVAIGCTVGRGRYSRAIGTTCQIANRYLNLPRRQTQVDKYSSQDPFPWGTSQYAACVAVKVSLCQGCARSLLFLLSAS